MDLREAAEDRISNLPDSLLHHIHSFLPIKDGARSSLVSKRWNYIWTTVPALDFKSPLSYYPIPPSSETEKFMDFVDGTLRRHNSSNIDKFFLEWGDHLNAFRVQSWISTVIRGNAKELGLHLMQKTPSIIPISLLTCESLISLQLHTYPSIRILPKYVSFPRLERLQLGGFEFSSEYWSEDLFSNSTVLEELTLNYCKFSTRNFCISVPTLKHLSIGSWDEEIDSRRLHVLKIDAPRIVTFYYYGYVPKEFVLSSSLALVEATVYVSADVKETNQLLRALAHVKCLIVIDTTLQAIYSTYGLPNNLLKLHNVKMLKVSDALTSDQGLIALLKAIPNLESLVFVEHMDGKLEDSDEEDENDHNHDHDERDVADAAPCGNRNESGDDSWALDIMTTGCLLPQLKSVCFQQFVGNPREIKWLRLIMRDAKALQMMSIINYNPYGDYVRFLNAKSKEELMEEIPTFPRASPSCVIKLGWKDLT